MFSKASSECLSGMSYFGAEKQLECLTVSAGLQYEKWVEQKNFNRKQTNSCLRYFFFPCCVNFPLIYKELGMEKQSTLCSRKSCDAVVNHGHSESLLEEISSTAQHMSITASGICCPVKIGCEQVRGPGASQTLCGCSEALAAAMLGGLCQTWVVSEIQVPRNYMTGREDDQWQALHLLKACAWLSCWIGFVLLKMLEGRSTLCELGCLMGQGLKVHKETRGCVQRSVLQVQLLPIE